MMSNLNVDTQRRTSLYEIFLNNSWTISNINLREADSCLEIEEIYLNDDLLKNPKLYTCVILYY